MRKAFTLMELVFVIVVIGILASIAAPKLIATRDDATITKAKSTLASLRSSLTQEVQRRQMEGNYTLVKNLGGTVGAFDSDIFDFFDGNNANARVLEYPLKSCKDRDAVGCWMRLDDTNGYGTYSYISPVSSIGDSATIQVDNNRLTCTPNPADSEICDYLEH